MKDKRDYWRMTAAYGIPTIKVTITKLTFQANPIRNQDPQPETSVTVDWWPSPAGRTY